MDYYVITSSLTQNTPSPQSASSGSRMLQAYIAVIMMSVSALPVADPSEVERQAIECRLALKHGKFVLAIKRTRAVNGVVDLTVARTQHVWFDGDRTRIDEYDDGQSTAPGDRMMRTVNCSNCPSPGKSYLYIGKGSAVLALPNEAPECRVLKSYDPRGIGYRMSISQNWHQERVDSFVHSGSKRYDSCREVDYQGVPVYDVRSTMSKTDNQISVLVSPAKGWNVVRITSTGQSEKMKWDYECSSDLKKEPTTITGFRRKQHFA